MRRNQPLKRKTRIKGGGTIDRKAKLARVSKKRASETADRRRCVEDVIARDGGCVPALRGAPGRCGGPLTAHELVKRSAGGSHLDPANCVACCWLHNGWIEDNPQAARDLGLVQRRAPRVLP